MIHDALSNHKKYLGTTTNLDKGFQFLAETDLTTLPTGTYKIDGDTVFAIVMEYETKEKDASIIEAHYNYIDIHYVISGAEGVGLATLTNQKPTEVNREKDYAFYNCNTEVFLLQETYFAVLFPEDIHQTGIQIEQPKKLKKVVVKVSVQSTDE